jgi:hypothetical protein
LRAYYALLDEQARKSLHTHFIAWGMSTVLFEIVAENEDLAASIGITLSTMVQSEILPKYWADYFKNKRQLAAEHDSVKSSVSDIEKGASNMSISPKKYDSPLPLTKIAKDKYDSPLYLADKRQSSSVSDIEKGTSNMSISSKMPKKLAKAMYDSPLPLFSFDDYERRCNECAVELNAHIKHALTCTKSKVGKVQCRLCYDQAIQEAKTGPALLAEDGTQLNGYQMGTLNPYHLVYYILFQSGVRCYARYHREIIESYITRCKGDLYIHLDNWTRIPIVGDI